MKYTLSFPVMLITVVLFATGSTLSPRRLSPLPKNISPDVKARCDAIGRTKCNARCSKSTNVIGYYTAKGKSSGKINLMSIYTFSVCGKCYTRFSIRKGGMFTEVSCDEFYSLIEKKNRECGNCVKEVKSSL